MLPVTEGRPETTVGLLDGMPRLRTGTLPTAAERGKAVSPAKPRKA